MDDTAHPWTEQILHNQQRIFLIGGQGLLCLLMLIDHEGSITDHTDIAKIFTEHD